VVGFLVQRTEGGVRMPDRSHGSAVLDKVMQPTPQPTEGLWVLADLEGLSVGERIKALRDDRHWSAQKLADECSRVGASSLTRSALAKVENGLRRLQIEEAVPLAQVLDIPLDDLLGGEADEPEAVVTPARRPRAGGGFDRPGPAPSSSEPVRRVELDLLLNGLSTVGEPRFWLVTAPPGMGKTTLLRQLDGELGRTDSGWETSRVDLRAEPPGLRTDTMALLARLFYLDSSALDPATIHRAIAQRLSRGDRRFVCLLDSAEELSTRAVRQLRSSLGEVHRLLEQTGNPDVELAFVVASRLDAGWLGSGWLPRVSALTLPEFGVDVVEERLRAWAAQTDRSPAERFDRTAALVHRVTAGLPILLDPVLDWIRNEEWLDLHRLDSHEVFESLAGRFIDDGLLGQDSLFPADDAVTPARSNVLLAAVSYLVRYRFFTLSHVRRLEHADAAFKDSLERSKWSVEDLWSALGGSALLARPLPEPWREFHPAIRRLLFRHFYAIAADGAAAHHEAAGFMTEWATSQTGRDQVMGLVEGLWHSAAALRLAGESPDAVREKLRNNATEFAGTMKDTVAFSAEELREYAAGRVLADAELQESVAKIKGLSDELIDILTGQE
jgi:transcriptional regulator with XRE-family HTH domain